MTVDEVSQIVNKKIKSYVGLKQYFPLDYQGCSGILCTGNTISIMLFVRKNSSEAAEEKETVFKIHHIKKVGSSNLKFWPVCVNCISLCQGCVLRFILH